MPKHDRTGGRAGAASSRLSERLLAGGFHGACLAMRTAAQYCGIRDELEAPGSERGRPLVDFRALSLVDCMPLWEIAAAERELS